MTYRSTDITQIVKCSITSLFILLINWSAIWKLYFTRKGTTWSLKHPYLNTFEEYEPGKIPGLDNSITQHAVGFKVWLNSIFLELHLLRTMHIWPTFLQENELWSHAWQLPCAHCIPCLYPRLWYEDRHSTHFWHSMVLEQAARKHPVFRGNSQMGTTTLCRKEMSLMSEK